jgi:hypothetical protein
MNQNNHIKLLILLSIFFTRLLADNITTLKVDTNGHMKAIKDIIVTKDDDIISASDDYFIKIWDSETGNLKRKFLWSLGNSNQENITKIALSPDETILAVIGWFENHEIRLFDYKTGRLISSLKAHDEYVNVLDFSEDGSKLVSGSFDNTVILWNISLLKEKNYYIKTLKKFNKGILITNVKFKEDFIVASSYKQIVLMNVDGKILNSYNTESIVVADSIEINENKIVAIESNTLLIFDFYLNLVKTIKLKDDFFKSSFSKDNKYLLVGNNQKHNNLVILDTENNYKVVYSHNLVKLAPRNLNFINKDMRLNEKYECLKT